MIDPKRVELTPYNSIPQLAVLLLFSIDKAIEALPLAKSGNGKPL